ncbi:MAG: succinate dehydrogenase/fumarate reductase cytochrome b subunit [Muribaculaceae bacterium]|nr:succinate dehydrogenase/fumarate reductase cytochrome b subunit [Muribaculaceae bacterium]MBQ4005280.1 succinate dehydrogenase/fumarate reductase cytochrome b subunit [Muribaculaceae bacterium]
MWLTNSSVGRKVVMSVTGLFLILFLTFHALMNAVALISLDAYEAVCEFLGANWYALLGTAILAGGFVLHIIYAFWLTLQNKRARGNDAYTVTARPKSVEWASQNMLVLGLIVLCFLVLHLFHFWAKMQLPEMLGDEISALRGKEALELAFSQLWVLPVYLVGFCAIWFHITHGFWSAFQTLGTTNDKWIERFKCIGWWWATIVMLLFAVEACYFTWFFAL